MTCRHADGRCLAPPPAVSCYPTHQADGQCRPEKKESTRDPAVVGRILWHLGLPDAVPVPRAGRAAAVAVGGRRYYTAPGLFGGRTRHGRVPDAV